MRDLPEGIAAAIESVDLPPLPQILVRFLKAVDDDLVSVNELTSLVRQDVALTARILSAANSASYGHHGSVTTIEDSLVVLGTRVVQSMATVLAVRRMFDGHGTGRQQPAGFWMHSMLCADLARSIAEIVGYPRPDEAYLGGLLHNAGQLLLRSALDDRYESLISGSRDELEQLQRESSQLETQHAEIGAWLIDQWHLESSLADSVLFHHASLAEIATAGPLPRIVWAANFCSRGREPDQAQASLATLFDAKAERIVVLYPPALARTEALGKSLGIAAATAEDHGPDGGMARFGSHALCADRTEQAINEIVASKAMLAPLQSNLFGMESDAQLLLSLRESARILFGATRLAFLLISPRSGELTGAEVGGQPAIFGHTAIGLQSSSCLAAESIRRGVPLSSFEPPDPGSPVSLMDVQFMRALGSEGMLCVPMLAGHKPVGVMAFGLSRSQHAKLAKKLPWVSNFGRLGGVSLLAWRDAHAYERNAEEALAARLSQHTRRVLHEVGNPLSIIKSYLKILDSKLQDNDGLRGELGILREEIDRVSSIIRRMNDIPATGSGNALTEMNAVVRELLTLYGPPLFTSRGISLSSELPEGELFCACNRDVIKQIVLNLLKNASEAMGSGGAFSLFIRDGVHFDGIPYVEMTLGDTGPGLPPEAARRLSGEDPNPAPGGPRGIGLSVVSTLARQAGVRITTRSNHGRGTTASLLFPKKRERE